MAINLPKDPLLPADFKFKGKTDDNLKDLEGWLSELSRSIEDHLKDAYKDIMLGTSLHRAISATATSADLDNGEFIVRMSGTAGNLYTKISGTIYSATLTAV